MKSIFSYDQINISIFIFTYIIKIIFSQETIKYCSKEDIGTIISECKNSKRRIFFYWKNKCVPRNDNSTYDSLPENYEYNGCGDCKENQYLNYDLYEKQLYCSDCPFFTYSLGNKFEIDGNKKDWNQENLDKFSNFCLVVDDSEERLEKNKFCSQWQVSQDNQYLLSADSNKTDVLIFSDLILNVNLVKKGKLFFSYQKDTKIIDYNFNGVFKLYVNYFNTLTDYDLYTNWKDYSIELDAGSYTFLWVYSKQISENYPETKDFKLKIRSIKIDGVENSVTECIKCNKNSTTTRCRNCPDNFYFDDQKTACEECPQNTYSEKNSIGISSCKPKSLCTVVDGDYFQEDYYVRKDEKFFYPMNYKLNPLKFCDKSNIAELKKQFEKNPTLYYPTGFIFCSSGLCPRNFNSTDEGKYVCMPCLNNIYNNEELMGNSQNCNQGYTKKILYIYSKNYHNFTKSCRCTKERPIDEKFEENTLFIFNNTLISGINLPNNSIAEISNSFEIEGDEGLLTIKYSLERNITNVTSESIYFTLNGDIIDFINMNSPSTLGKVIFFSMSLKVGKYDFQIIYNRNNVTEDNSKLNLIKFEEISIKNSKYGGGYECLPCKNGLKTLNCQECKEGEIAVNGICNFCPEGTYKNEVHSRCERCPFFTYSSKSRHNCEPKGILEIKDYSYRFLMGGLNFMQKKECEGENKICYGSFIGPIDNIKEREIFYMSYNKREEIDISDFSYSTSKNKKSHGHVFYLKNSNNSNKENKNFERHENLKLLLNVGNYIEYIKAFPVMSHYQYRNAKTDGFYIKFTQGDVCVADPKKNYTSFLFVICDKYTSQNYPVFKMKSPDNCTFFFEWKTRYGCKNCNLDDTDKIYGICRDGKRNIFYQEREYCIVENSKIFRDSINTAEKSVQTQSEYFSAEGSEIMDAPYENLFYIKDSDDADLYLNKFFNSYDFEDMRTKKNKTVLIEDKPLNLLDYIKTNVSFINLTHESSLIYVETSNFETTCKIYEDFNNIIYLIVIIVPTLYLFLIVYLIVVYCRYRRIYSQYSRLREETTDNQTSNNERDVNKIELGNMSHVDNK